MNNTLIQVEGLKKYFPISQGLFKQKKYLKAVDGITFNIKRGETFGVVGESGCGKSTLGRTITRLYDVTDGKIIIDDVDITNLKRHELKSHRKNMQIIFQDPYSSLNPGMNVREIIAEPMKIHTNYSDKELENKIKETLLKVGLDTSSIDKFPHEFSGGQRQRIGIARAISVSPNFILCDEPISALDVSIQAQIVNTLEELQSELGISYLFIAHDLSMVRHISDNIGVMYLGKMVEIANNVELYKNPLHPYTQGLLSSIPVIGAETTFDNEIGGDVPSPIDLPVGCRFKSRCKYAMKKCSEIEPDMKDMGDGHMVACHLYDK